MTVIRAAWLTDPATVAVMSMLADAGHQAYFVGGCVRNELLNALVSDLDISTDALPDQVMALAKLAGLKAVPTGIDHGTVTVVSAGIAHEITTFRKDVETDGRRAVVAFSGDIADDARRRDFTMNALYADMNGNVLDPLGGLVDLQARRVRFIENADQRIKEDYLRSLRFFRFHAWYGNPNNGLDSDALAAIAANLGGLETLSKERIGSEVLKLLAANDPAPSVGSMEQAGVLSAILPGATTRALPILIDAESGIEPNALRRLTALGGQDVSSNLRLSRRDAKRLEFLRQAIGDSAGIAKIAYRNGELAAVDVALLRAAVFEMPVEHEYMAQAKFGANQTFPIQAADLMPDYQGKALGERMRKLENRWIHSNFELSLSQLLS